MTFHNSFAHAINYEGRHVMFSPDHPVCAECVRLQAVHQHTVDHKTGCCDFCGIQWWELTPTEKGE